jgi:hypothetical protein
VCWEKLYVALQITSWMIWGMLLGVDIDVFDIGAILEGDYFIKFNLHDKVDGFKWSLVSVYGPAQDCFKQDFRSELVHLSTTETLPVLTREILIF